MAGRTGWEIPWKRGLDIDTEDDWALAEVLAADARNADSLGRGPRPLHDRLPGRREVPARVVRARCAHRRTTELRALDRTRRGERRGGGAGDGRRVRTRSGSRAGPATRPATIRQRALAADRREPRRRRAGRQRRHPAPDVASLPPGRCWRASDAGRVRAPTRRRATAASLGADLHAAAGHDARRASSLAPTCSASPTLPSAPTLLRRCLPIPARGARGLVPRRRGPGCSERVWLSARAPRWTTGSTPPTWPVCCAPFDEQQVIEDTERVRRHFELVLASSPDGRAFPIASRQLRARWPPTSTLFRERVVARAGASGTLRSGPQRADDDAALVVVGRQPALRHLWATEEGAE